MHWYNWKFFLKFFGAESCMKIFSEFFLKKVLHRTAQFSTAEDTVSINT